MRFLLVFVLSFISVFAVAQVPMAVGGPQGIDVTRILARNWMAIPVMSDTPVAPLTGVPWPVRGFIVQVAKTGDTSVWQYTGSRWSKIAGASQETYTKLVTGGDVNQLGISRQYTVSPSTYYINGVYYNLSTQQTVTSAVKTANANGRIDVIALTTTGATVIQGTERPVPLKPSVGANRLELAAIYYPAFDTVSREIGEGGLTSVFRVLGRDSLYFTSGDSVISVKDSIGISKNDTASMLNPYKFTAANGLTKDSTVFRLGGSLNQNTNINLNTRRLTIIGGNDTTRFFGDGRVSIAGTPDSSNFFHLVNKKNSRFGNLEITSGRNAEITGQGIRIDGTDRPFIFQGSAGNISSSFIFSNWVGDTSTTIVGEPALSRDIVRVNFGFTRQAGTQYLDTGKYNILNIQPKYNIWYDSGRTIVRGIYYNPTIQALNKTNHIAYENTTGANLLNSVSGSTRIGYNTFDTTYKLDVNGTGRISSTFSASSGRGRLEAYPGDAVYVGGGSAGSRLVMSASSGNSSNIYFFHNGGYSGEVASNDTIGKLIINPINKLGFMINGAEKATLSPNGNLLVGTTTDVPSSKLTVTSTTQGFLQPRMTNVQRDSISSAQGLQIFSTTDSANYVYRGTGGGWQKIANEISGSDTLDFPSTGHGNSADLTITVTGADIGDVVALGIPNASIVANASYIAWVSATNTVTVRFNNYASSGNSDPASGTFKIKVFK